MTTIGKNNADDGSTELHCRLQDEGKKFLRERAAIFSGLHVILYRNQLLGKSECGNAKPL